MGRVTGRLGKALSFWDWKGWALAPSSQAPTMWSGRLRFPAMAWYAFEVCAARRKVDPASHLAVLINRSIANGITVAEMVEWLRL
jgi:hypothetical protein